ncbi:hypothetical protein G6F68_017913 [Rhizopus microsporus]|nr:hypothetical protein G6F68_017913 [Rhizopus microsporus]
MRTGPPSRHRGRWRDRRTARVVAGDAVGQRPRVLRSAHLQRPADHRLRRPGARAAAGAGGNAGVRARVRQPACRLGDGARGRNAGLARRTGQRNPGPGGPAVAGRFAGGAGLAVVRGAARVCAAGRAGA